MLPIQASLGHAISRGFGPDDEIDLTIEDMQQDGDQVEIARDCWRRFGKGRHRARLNFGDCFAYALSRTSGEPLLFKGDDFVHTDLDLVSVEQTL